MTIARSRTFRSGNSEAVPSIETRVEREEDVHRDAADVLARRALLGILLSAMPDLAFVPRRR
ncbi:MAG: hypothetical protein ABJA80_14600 [bacterium]